MDRKAQRHYDVAKSEERGGLGHGWYFEAVNDHDSPMHCIPLKPLPFRIGRNPDLPLTLSSRSVSRFHAELSLKRGQLVIKDLGSTNGTFVNQQQVRGSVVLTPGDIINIAHYEFQLAYTPPEQLDEQDETQQFDRQVRKGYLATLKDLHTLVNTEAVIPVFQPIIDLATQGRLGYELLGRGAMAGMPTPPKELFELAADAGMEAALSQLFRRKGVLASQALPSPLRLFVNVHPAELLYPEALVRSFREALEVCPDLQLHVEIHEAAVTDIAQMRDFQQALKACGIALGYDDFGAGQARLLELVEIPPDFVKFDISLIQQIDRACLQRRQMVRMLVELVRQAGGLTIAEGCERQEEVLECQQLGFDAAQGYFFSRPYPVGLHSETTQPSFRLGSDCDELHTAGRACQPLA